MKITVDLRSLHTNLYSGVEHFTVQTLEQLLLRDKENQYLLYYNGFKPKSFERFHFVNVSFRQTRIPSRLLNLSMKFLRWPRIETLAGDTRVLLMPNPNILRIRSTTKLVLVVHDLSPVVMPEMYSFKAQLWHKFIGIGKLCQRADKILAVSNFTKQSLVNDLGIKEDKIAVGLLGVDHDRYHADLEIDQLRFVRNYYNLPGKFILFIGTLEPRKNLARLIEAYENLPGDYSLVIAGKLGWRYGDIMSRLEKSAKARQIQYLGYVPETDKPYLMKLASVVAWPSLYEGFGLPVLEAMAVGTPVLTSNVSSLPEVAGDSALMIDPYQTNDITQGLQLLLEDENVRNMYMQRGIDRARQFTWEKTASVLEELLK